MKELIEQEKARIQKLFDEFNSLGSSMEWREGKKKFRLGIMDGYQVTRVAPMFDAAGNITDTHFWLFFKALGYNEGSQHAHTVKVVRWSQEETYELDLFDDDKRHFHIELIFPELERDAAEAWGRWGKYKGENKEMFERIDRQILEEHIGIAEAWE